MTLTEFVVSLSPEQKIMVGTENGFGFLYVGTAGDMVDNLDIYSDVLRKKYSKPVNDAIRKLNLAINRKHDPADYCFNLAHTPGAEISSEGYSAYMNRYFETIHARKLIFDRRVKNLDAFIKLGERTITSSFLSDSAIDPDYLKVIISGSEGGAYYFSAEARCVPVFKWKADDEEDEQTCGKEFEKEEE